MPTQRQALQHPPQTHLSRDAGLFHAQAGIIEVMDANRNEDGAFRVLVFAATSLLVLLPFLYLLSVGPATWLYCRGYLSAKTSDIFFAPLDWTCDHCNPLMEFCDWYKTFFVPDNSMTPPTF